MSELIKFPGRPENKEQASLEQILANPESSDEDVWEGLRQFCEDMLCEGGIEVPFARSVSIRVVAATKAYFNEVRSGGMAREEIGKAWVAFYFSRVREEVGLSPTPSVNPTTKDGTQHRRTR